MNEQDIKNLVHSRECQGMEWKASLAEKHEIGKTVSAFANTNDGIILVGISPQGSYVGVSIGKNTLENLANQIKQSTDPKTDTSIVEYSIDEKNIIKISVSEAVKKPVFFKGTPYQRVGRTNQIMSRDRIAELMSQSGQITPWDGRICKGAELEDIDTNKVKWFMEKARSERGSDINPDIPTKESLERLDLIQDEQITNAAILLFGNNPQKFFRQAKTKCGRFKGTEPIDFLDMKEFEGNIIDQRDKAIEFLREHIQLQAKVVGTERVEKWDYPIEAIREAVTNAICHRDYEMTANIQVRIYDDRIEIWGCGTLPHPLTVEDLKRDHRSIPRNPLIGDCFFRIKFIEQWGTGTNRIISSCQEHGLPTPLFEQRPDGLIVTLRKAALDVERAIIDYITNKGSISTRECIQSFNISRGAAQRYLSLLERQGLISRRGGGRSTRYVLSDAEKTS